MTHLSLFSGIGGIDLAAEWAGFETVAFVERDKFCQKVLAKHWPGVPIYDDVKEFGIKEVAYTEKLHSDGGDLHREHAKSDVPEPGNDSVKKPTIHLLSGGFPCQPFSVAGKRGGTSDSRFLWDEMLRVIREVEPVWVLGENVRGLLSIDGGRTFGTIIHDLASVGYRVGWGVYGACHVGAPHRRERVFIVAHSCLQPDGKTSASACAKRSQRDTRDDALRCSWAHGPRHDRWEPEPSVGRVAHGVPNRVDRLGALGNAVVPQQVYPILKAIADQIQIKGPA